MNTVQALIDDLRETMRKQASAYPNREAYFSAVASAGDVAQHNIARFYYGGHRNPTASTVDAIASAVHQLETRAAA